MASSSEKWETVGKPKSGGAQGKQQNGKGGGSKKAVPSRPMPKIEDVLPPNSIKNIYLDHGPGDGKPAANNNSPKKDKKGADNKKSQANGNKKDVVQKPKPPTTLEEAVKANLKLEDLKHLIDESQTRFPDSPLLLLRDIAAFLNQRLDYEPAAGGKPEEVPLECLSSLPLSALSQNMRKAINNSLNSFPDAVKEGFIETCIVNAAHDMSKNLPVSGWRVLAQTLVEVNPSLVLSSISRYIELRNSYQNRPAIGLGILWSVGQAGHRDLATGVRVWMEVMLPVITLRHYTKFVVEYISKLLKLHATTTLTKPLMDIPKFITLQDTVFVISGQMNKEYARQLREEVYPRLRQLALGGCKNHELFPAMMEKLAAVTMPEQILDTLSVLADTLVGTPASLVHWHKMYTTHLSESGQLLMYLYTNWDIYKSTLMSDGFVETLEAFEDYNANTNTQKEAIHLCREACAALSAKLESCRKKSWFPWKTLSLILLISTAAIINMDVNKNGSFKKSHCGLFLQDIGQYDRVMRGYENVHHGYRQSEAWALENLPVYYNKFRQVTGPALDVAVAKCQEVGGQGYDYLLVGWTNVKHGVDRYLPIWQERAVYYTQLGVKQAEHIGQSIGKTIQDVINGKVDWELMAMSVKEKAVELKNMAVDLFK